jgi:hypothetical protein
MTFITHNPIPEIPLTTLESAIAKPANSPATKDDSLAPEPVAGIMLSDDAIYEIAAMLAQTASDDRKAGRALRNAQEARIEAETAKRIQAMRDKADQMRTAAMITGVAGMAAGACQIAGGVSSMKEAAKIETTGRQTTLVINQETGACGLGRELSSEQAAINQLASAKAGAYGQLAGGASGFLQSAGGFAAGLVQASAEEYDADAALHQAKTDRAERAVEQHTDAMADAKRLQDKAMEFLKDVRASQNGAAQSAIRG